MLLRQRVACSFDIELWDGLAVAAAGELRKGEFVQVLGKLKMNEWLNKQGVKQRSVRVNVSQIHRVRPPSEETQVSIPSSHLQNEQWPYCHDARSVSLSSGCWYDRLFKFRFSYELDPLSILDSSTRPGKCQCNLLTKLLTKLAGMLVVDVYGILQDISGD